MLRNLLGQERPAGRRAASQGKEGSLDRVQRPRLCLLVHGTRRRICCYLGAGLLYGLNAELNASRHVFHYGHTRFLAHEHQLMPSETHCPRPVLLQGKLGYYALSGHEATAGPCTFVRKLTDRAAGSILDTSCKLSFTMGLALGPGKAML